MALEKIQVTLDAMLMVYMKRTAIEGMAAHPELKEQGMRIFDKVALFEDAYLAKLMKERYEDGER